MSEDMVVKSLFKTVQAERDMWQDRAEEAERLVRKAEFKEDHERKRAEAAEARVKVLGRKVTTLSLELDQEADERLFWQDRAEAAEARINTAIIDQRSATARCYELEARVQELEGQITRTKMGFDGRPTDFNKAEMLLNTDIIRELEARAEAAEAKLHELSVKYTVALDQNREMGEALKNIEELGRPFPSNAVDCGVLRGEMRDIARAAIASQQAANA
jgi:chromosome segregation ATPase